MQRWFVIGFIFVLAVASGRGTAEGLCTPRQSFELVVTDQVSPANDPRNLTDNQGNPLGCAISRDKAAGELCAGANDADIPFVIAVRNTCQKPVDVVVRVKKSHAGFRNIDFRSSVSCDRSLGTGGSPATLSTGGELKTECNTIAYPKESFPIGADYAGFFTIDVTKVDNTPTRNGKFDPQIAVERDGDVTTSFPWWKMLLLLAAGFGTLVGWFGRKWWHGGPQTA